MSKQKPLSQRVQEKHPDFAAEVEGLGLEALKARIVGIQQALAESEAHKEANEIYQKAKAEYNELAGVYKDVKSASSLKTKYILELIREKGGG